MTLDTTSFTQIYFTLLFKRFKSVKKKEEFKYVYLTESWLY